MRKLIFLISGVFFSFSLFSQINTKNNVFLESDIFLHDFYHEVKINNLHSLNYERLFKFEYVYVTSRVGLSYKRNSNAVNSNSRTKFLQFGISMLKNIGKQNFIEFKATNLMFFTSVSSVIKNYTVNGPYDEKVFKRINLSAASFSIGYKYIPNNKGVSFGFHYNKWGIMNNLGIESGYLSIVFGYTF